MIKQRHILKRSEITLNEAKYKGQDWKSWLLSPMLVGSRMYVFAVLQRTFFYIEAGFWQNLTDTGSAKIFFLIWGLQSDSEFFHTGTEPMQTFSRLFIVLDDQ